MPSNIAEITIETVRTLLPLRPDEAHKGTFGHVLVIAGSRGFMGAARFAAAAACRSGVGLVTLASPLSIRDVAISLPNEVMTLQLPSTDDEAVAHSAVQTALAASVSRTAVTLGPGLSQHASTKAFVQDFVRQCTRPTIIDADGLNCLGRLPELLQSPAAPRILTPHPGEMSRLTGQSVAEVQANRVEIAAEFAQTFECVLVLKGRGTVVAQPDGSAHVNTTGNAGLAKGGTGDVLAGVLGALLAQGLAPAHAALLGVYVHGLAGDLAAAVKTKRGMIATDVIDFLPEAWKYFPE